MSLIDKALKANQRYAKKYDRKLGGHPAPKVAVVTCMDPRLSDLPGILGLPQADLDVIRTGGPAVTQDVLGELVVSTRVLGSTEIMLLNHTGCGFTTFTDEELNAKLTALTGDASPHPGRPAGRVDQRAVVLGEAFERLPGEVEAVEAGIAALEPGDDGEGLRVVIEPAFGGEAGIECALSGMAEWRMAEVVRERQRLGQVLIEPQLPGQSARNLRDLERVGQPSAIMVALVKNKNLGLVLETAKRGGVDDAVAIAPKCAAACAWRLGIEPAAA